VIADRFSLRGPARTIDRTLTLRKSQAVIEQFPRFSGPNFNANYMPGRK